MSIHARRLTRMGTIQARKLTGLVSGRRLFKRREREFLHGGDFEAPGLVCRTGS